MKILAIDTSCDETAASVSEENILLSNTLSSSMEFQNEWGGVVPMIARKNHVERIDRVIKRALKLAGVTFNEIDAVAVTYGPGLAIALEVGVAKAKELALRLDKPLIAVNHMAGHIYANFGKKLSGATFSGLKEEGIFPVMALLISGGHTELVYMRSHLDFEIVGRTLDDSAGEAFDKVARMLRWGYPGGPIVERFACDGDENKFKFPIAMLNSKDLNFSFSGLKTAVMREIQSKGEPQDSNETLKLQKIKQQNYKAEVFAPTISKKVTYKLSSNDSKDIAASFQKAVTQQLIVKVLAAIKLYPVKSFLLGGGVVNNLYIRKSLRAVLRKKGVVMYFPKNKKLLTDNAGMIAIAASYKLKAGKFSDPEKLDRKPGLELGKE